MKALSLGPDWAMDVLLGENASNGALGKPTTADCFLYVQALSHGLDQLQAMRFAL